MVTMLTRGDGGWVGFAVADSRLSRVLCNPLCYNRVVLSKRLGIVSPQRMGLFYWSISND